MLFVQEVHVAERFQRLFPFHQFNAMQTECFDMLYHGNSHAVISSPTGSGKTVLLELAMIQVFKARGIDAKVIYIAPMKVPSLIKALCSERAKDWSQKFRPLNITCFELTGDTAYSQMSEVQKGNIM